MCKFFVYLFTMAFCPCTTQVRLAKDRKKGDKIVSDSQERAYWRAYRPPPGCLNCLEHPPYRHPNATSTSSRRKWNSINDIKTEVLYCNHPPTHFRMSPDEESMALKTARLRSIFFFPSFSISLWHRHKNKMSRAIVMATHHRESRSSVRLLLLRLITNCIALSVSETSLSSSKDAYSKKKVREMRGI